VKPALLGEVEVAAGQYDVRLVPATQGMTMELTHDGATAARELATHPPTQPTHENSAAWLWHDRRDESMYRVYAQEGRDLYFITLMVAD